MKNIIFQNQNQIELARQYSQTHLARFIYDTNINAVTSTTN